MSKERYRDVRTQNYTQVENNMVNDSKLSLEGKGLMTIFLSNSNDWEINMKEIIKRSKNGRDAHYRVVNELIEKGYFARVQILDKDSKKFEEMEYLFSDVKTDVKKALDKLKEYAEENGKSLVIEYEVKKEKKKKDPVPENQETEKEPLPESQDTEEKPLPKNEDTENSYTENKDINNTKGKNTNLNNTKNLNPNLNRVDIYEILWNTNIFLDLKVKIKNLLILNEISLTPKQILELEDAYFYQREIGNVVPNGLDDDVEALNDKKFMKTVVRMLETVKDIRNMKGLVQEWVLNSISYYRSKILDINFNPSPDSPYYDWLNDEKDQDEDLPY